MVERPRHVRAEWFLGAVALAGLALSASAVIAQLGVMGSLAADEQKRNAGM